VTVHSYNEPMNDNQTPPIAAFSDLIARIYDTASDHTLWPALLKSVADYLSAAELDPALPVPALEAERMVSSWFDGTGTPLPFHQSAAEEYVFSCLAPHFVRAQEMHRQWTESDQHRRSLEAAMDTLPLGLAVVESSGLIVSINGAMRSMLRHRGALLIDAGRLVSRPRRALDSALRQIFAEGSPDVSLQLGGTEDRLSVWVSQIIGSQEEVQQPRALVWVASQDEPVVSESGLCERYGTTPAEARLIRQLLTGQSLSEIASNLGVSLNTVKTQLQSVFAKVGVNRQSQLIQAVCTLPPWLRKEGAAQLNAFRSPPSSTTLSTVSNDGQRMRLPDGRWLAWSDNGDPNGLPILFMHGIAGSRHLRHPDDGILLEHRLRLIIPERPGTGDSDPLPSRTVMDWPKDVAILADRLELPRFVVLGYSGGTPYALATAHALPQRVISVHVVGATPPIERMEDLKAYSPQFRMAMMVARYSPSLFPPLMRFVLRSIRGNVYAYLEGIMRNMTERDRVVFEDATLRENYILGLLAGTKHGTQYLVSEGLLGVHGWSARELQISVPIDFYHGDADWHIAIDAARRLAEQIPGARLHVIPDAGHFLIYSHWRELLKGIREGAVQAKGVIPDQAPYCR
jgi:pimeloyl-ACP methyl ester carboxylesterase/DNA-binding CsgD family transcriptional regulator